MADDNPFDFKFGSGLLGLLNAPPQAKHANALTDWTPLDRALGTPWPQLNDKPKNALADWKPPATSMGDLLGLGRPSPFSLAALGLEKSQPPPSSFSNALADIVAPPSPSPFGLGVLSGHFPAADPPTPAPSGLGSLAGLFGSSLSGLGSASVFEPTPPTPLTFGALSGHFPSSEPPTPFGALYPTPAPPPPKPVTPAVTRKAFFSFHYDDVMRTSVVRKAWVFKHPTTR
jgi:hypothetical protein